VLQCRHTSTKLLVPFLSLSIVTALGIAWTVSASSGPQQYASYHNDRWHFSLAAPADMKVETFSYADGGEQLSFANPGGEVFTITAVPYSQLDLVLGELRAKRQTSLTISRS
jgi:hypothetical protein